MTRLRLSLHHERRHIQDKQAHITSPSTTEESVSLILNPHLSVSKHINPGAHSSIIPGRCMLIIKPASLSIHPSSLIPHPHPSSAPSQQTTRLPNAHCRPPTHAYMIHQTIHRSIHRCRIKKKKNKNKLEKRHTKRSLASRQ